MIHYPKISIITPSYNQGQYIEQTILSVINQGYPNYELIIIDGGSTDHTVDIIRKYEDYIAYWVSEPDKGQADAINKGIVKATGDVFNWINSDDYLEEGALQTVGQFFVQNPNKQVLCGFTRCFYDDDNSTSHTYRMGIQASATATIVKIEMNQPGTFYRMDVVKALGGVNSSLRYIFDNELWFRYLTKYGTEHIGTTDALLAQFRLHKTSKSVYEGFALFDQESQAIWQWLAKQYQLAQPIQTFLAEEKSANTYTTSVWEGAYLNKKLLEQHFAAKYLVNLLLMGAYQLARKGFLYKYQYKQLPLDRKHLSAFVKLFLFPGCFKS